MGKMIKYTLKAARRGNHRRGQILTTPELSELDQNLRNDPAWARQELSQIAVPEGKPQPMLRAQQAFAQFLGNIQTLAMVIGALSADEQRHYAELFHANVEKIRDKMDIVFPSPVELEVPVGDDAEPRGGDELDQVEAAEDSNTPEKDNEQAAHLSNLLAIIARILAGEEVRETMPNMVELATRAGLDVPDKRPRTKRDFALLLQGLAQPNPEDLG